MTGKLALGLDLPFKGTDVSGSMGYSAGVEVQAAYAIRDDIRLNAGLHLNREAFHTDIESHGKLDVGLRVGIEVMRGL